MKDDKHMNVISILNNRKSVRKYADKKVSHEILDKLITYGEKSEIFHSNIDMEFKLITHGHSFYRKIHGHAGYFGKVFDAPHYIIAISEERDGFLENIGYRMEKLMIMAHEFGLSTCWLELLFGTEKINKLLNIEKGYKALVFTPIGYEKSSLINKLVKIDDSKKIQRKALKEIVTFKEWDNYRLAKSSIESDYLKIIQYAGLAPSWGNKQPWKFLIDDSKVLVFCEKDKIRRRKEKLNYYKIDCGIIMLYFKLLAEEFGMKGRWMIADNKLVTNKYRVPDNYEYIGFYTVS